MVAELIELVRKELIRTGIWVVIAIAMVAVAAYFWK